MDVLHAAEEYEQHLERVQDSIKNQRIVLSGETLVDQNQKTSNKNESMKTEIFMLFNALDEREPHDFLHRDPLF